MVVLRPGNEGAEEALKEDHVTPMDFTGKPMKSMVYLQAEGYEEDEVLEAWDGKASGLLRGCRRSSE